MAKWDPLHQWEATGDADADRVVHALLGETADYLRAAQVLEGLLRWDAQSPATSFPVGVQDFLAGAAAPMPEWLDPDTVHRAQTLFAAHRFSGITILACAGLPACYAQPEIAAVLVGSGQLLARVRGRLQDTADFVDVVMTPGSLDPGGAGFRWIRKLRMLHALMRALAAAPPMTGATADTLSAILLAQDWQGRASIPVSQLHLAFVLQTFSWLVLRGWRRLGIRLSDEACKDHVMTWCWIGGMLGIDEKLLPCRRESALRDSETLFEAIYRHEQARHDRERKDAAAGGREGYDRDRESGRLLAAALIVVAADAQRRALVEAVIPTLGGFMKTFVEWFLRTFPRWSDDVMIGMPRTLVRKLAGEAIADVLWVGRVPFLNWLPGWFVNRKVNWNSQVLNRYQPVDTRQRASASAVALGVHLRRFVDQGGHRSRRVAQGAPRR